MYGLSLLAGILVASLVGERLCRLRGYDTQTFWRSIYYAVIFGFIGARIYHVVHGWGYYSQHPPDTIKVWNGGLGIWGGIFGAGLGIYLALRNSSDLWIYADIFAVCAPLAQAIGRWGNFFNKELFGYPTTLPWGIFIPLELRPQAFRYYQHFHPLFLYESLLDLILFAVLYKMFLRDRAKPFVCYYLIGYSLIRFVLEFMRPDPWKLLGLPVSVIISVLVFIFCLIFLLKKLDLSHSKKL